MDKKKKDVCIGVNITPELHQKIKVAAEKQTAKQGVNYSLSDIVRAAIVSYLATLGN